MAYFLNLTFLISQINIFVGLYMFRLSVLILSFFMTGCITLAYHPKIQTMDEDYRTKEAVFKTSVKRGIVFGKASLDRGSAFVSHHGARIALKKLVRSRSKDFCSENAGNGKFLITKRTKKKELAYYDTQTSSSSVHDSYDYNTSTSYSGSSTTTMPVYDYFSLLKVQCQ